jgi:hypothetical protein
MTHDPRYLEGIRLFNEGKFHAAHDAWEDLWHERFGEERNFLQGIIQIAVAFHHWENGNAYGARKLYRQSAAHLNGYPPVYWEFPLARWRETCDRLMEPLLRGESDEAPPFPSGALPEIRLPPAASAKKPRNGV